MVVIGILIALQINNWNEGRNKEQELNLILTTVKKDLQSDIGETDFFIENYQDRLNKMDTILGGHATEEYLKNCSICPNLTTGISKVSLNTRGYDLLKSFSLDGTMINDSLTMMIDNLFIGMDAIDKLVVKKIEDITFESLDDMKNNQDWFIPFLEKEKATPEILKYIGTDKRHLARMAMLRLLIRDNYIAILKGFKKEAEIIIERIEKRVDD